MQAWAKRVSDGWLLAIHVQPGARRSEVVGVHGEALKIRVAAPAAEDRANEELLRFLAESLDVSRRALILERGARSRRKLIRVIAPSAQPEALLPPP
jgi:uncharacterized protein (TIGR00251 family)